MMLRPSSMKPAWLFNELASAHRNGYTQRKPNPTRTACVARRRSRARGSERTRRAWSQPRWAVAITFAASRSPRSSHSSRTAPTHPAPGKRLQAGDDQQEQAIEERRGGREADVRLSSRPASTAEAAGTEGLVVDVRVHHLRGVVGTAAREDLDEVEYLEAAEDGQEQDDQADLAQTRNRYVPEPPRRTGAVDAGSLIELGGDRLQPGQEVDQVVTQRVPDADRDDYPQNGMRVAEPVDPMLDQVEADQDLAEGVAEVAEHQLEDDADEGECQRQRELDRHQHHGVDECVSERLPED